MRIRTTLAALAALAAGLAPVPATAATAGTNWVLYRVKLQPTARSFYFSFNVTEAVPQTEHTMHLDAVGWGSGRWTATTQEREHLYGGHGYAAVDLTSPVDVSQHARVGEDPDPAGYTVHGVVGASAAGGTFHLLFASLSGRFLDSPSLVVNHSATATLVASGSDAGYLAARGAGTGLGAGVSGFGPARTTNTATFGKGALFTVPVFDCYQGDCTWDGVAPGGATLHHVDHVVRGGGTGEGPSTLVGDAGTWQWSLDALVYDGYAMVGYVPIGRYVDA